MENNESRKCVTEGCPNTVQVAKGRGRPSKFCADCKKKRSVSASPQKKRVVKAKAPKGPDKRVLRGLAGLAKCMAKDAAAFERRVAELARK
ncbi:MAG: hypothetical protein HC945_00160 [Nitrosarchaeum sp.]|nr:hypothetical protein [Nitrosarchaeum sp.]